jgi:hypothetical protein
MLRGTRVSVNMVAENNFLLLSAFEALSSSRAGIFKEVVMSSLN